MSEGLRVERAMRMRMFRMMAALFCVCLLASACDMEDVLQLTPARDVDADQADAGHADGEQGDGDQADAGDGDQADAGDADQADAGDADQADAGDGDQPEGSDGPPAPDGGTEQPETFSCDHTIPSGTDEVDGNGNMSAVRPGDTVCLTAGTRGPLELHNFHGAASNPITFVNHGGTVNIRGNGDFAGIHIEHSDQIRVTGAGVEKRCGATVAAGAQRCGIRILGAERGVAGTPVAERLTVDHVEMGDTSQAAFVVKDDSKGRKWVAHDIVLNHNYLHDVYDEGVYIGSSYYDSGEFHLLDGVHVGYNLVERTGRDGLQVGSTTQDCTMHHNVIRDTGRNGESSHLAGIMNNKGSVCDIFSNVISDTAGWAIYLQGNGGNKVYNNAVVRSGRAVTTSSKQGDGIAIHDGSNSGNAVYVWNNTIVSSRSEGIDWNLDAASGQVYNNLVVAAGTKAIDGDSSIDMRNNLAVDAVSAVGFVDAARDNYQLRTGSPAIDAGMRLNGVASDINGVRRPQGAGYDIGSYERRG